ncbi:MAG: serine/threonine-protein kinase [Actinomycetes bacterium]
MTATDLPRGYEPVRVLGSGGYGEVVLAKQMSLNRMVAVKRIHAYLLTGPDDQARFRREAQVLAALDAPCIVRVHDFITEGPAAFLVMEHVPGQTLAELLDAGPVPVQQALVVLRDVAEALRTADRNGVVHRDVKPGNVFVLPDGRAKLGDFGLARVMTDPSVFRTTDGTVAGTPAYFPPESGASDPDIRSDAYSFGAMAFEVLTGRLPFEGEDTAQLLAAHLTAPPPAADELVPGFPPAAARALEAALAKEPAARLLPWELVDRLERVPAEQWPGATAAARTGAAPETVRTSPPPMASPAVPALPRRRSRTRRALLGVVAFAALTAAAVVGSSVLRDEQGDADEVAPLAVQGVQVSVDPADGVGSCPRARYEFTASLQTAGAGTARVVWTRPDGRTTEPAELEVQPGQTTATAVLAFEVTGELPLEGAAVLQVLEPTALTATSPPVTYRC